MNKWLCEYLVAALLLMATTTVHAAVYSGGSGTPGDPYEITTPDDWTTLANTPGDWYKNFLLTADIDFTNGDITPVGNAGHPFTGVVDGNRHVLMNWQMNLPESEYVGLFGYLGQGGRIEGLGVEGASVNGRNMVGALVGCNEGSIIACYADAAVSGGSYGQVIGGLVGYGLRGEITACYAGGTVLGSLLLGGLAGEIYSGNVTACYSTAMVLGDNLAGGLVGSILSGTVTACYATGLVTGFGNLGGLAGWCDGQVLYSYYDMDGTGQHYSAGGRGLTAAQMCEVFYYQVAGWHAYPWVMNAGAPPRLDWEGLGWPAISAPGPLPLDGSGAEGDPFLVGTAADFSLLSWRVADLEYKHIRMTTDIDLEGVNLYPIGEVHVPFNGKFEGDGHILSNGKISLADEEFVGLFGYVGEQGAIDNLGVEGISIRGLGYAGGLAGLSHGSVTSCHVSGEVRGAAYNSYSVGGLIGYNAGSISSCHSSGTVAGTWGIGGLTGHNEGTVTNSFSTCTIPNGTEIGGLAGSNGESGTITACFASGEVNGYRQVGGLVGVNYYGAITASYATGPVWADYEAGGLLGVNYHGTSTACYATGAVSGYGVLGGLVGYREGGVISEYWDMDGTGQDISAGGRGLTAAQMGEIFYYQIAGWHAYPWVMQEGAPPRLDWEGLGWPAVPEPGPLPFSGSGTEGDPYEIGSAADFSLLGWYAAELEYSHLLLTGDIDLSGAKLYPLGDLTPFSGVFDGGGHVLQNGLVQLPKSDYVGLFGCLGPDGEIRNLGVEAVEVSGRKNVGGLVGFNQGTITSCHVSGTVTGSNGSDSVGGLAGRNIGQMESCNATIELTCDANSRAVGGLAGSNEGVVTSCQAGGAVTCGVNSNAVGGLAGLNTGTVLSSCATGTVTGNAYTTAIGGLLGEHDGMASSCYATGAVTGGSGMGGLTGRVEGGTITACYATGAAAGEYNVGGLTGDLWEGEIRCCYAAGPVTGEGGLGGLVGSSHWSSVLSSFWDMNGTGQGFSDGGKGLSAAQMGQAFYFKFAGWSAYPWVMLEGSPPRLEWEGPGWPAIPEPGPVPLAGTGTEADPYQVGTAEEFALLNWCVASLEYRHIRLTEDIDLEGIHLYSIGGSEPFNGVFDGSSHLISSARIYQPEDEYVGLFGRLGESGKIRNLRVENISVTGHRYVGGVVGQNDGEVTSCYCSGRVAGLLPYSYMVGGLAGVNCSTVRSCDADVSVSGTERIGGLAGSNTGVIMFCRSLGTALGSTEVGGLVGTNVDTGSVAFCHTGTAVTGQWRVGGLAGANFGGTIMLSYSRGVVNGSHYIGGLVGGASQGVLASCYATGAIRGFSYLGGLVGYNDRCLVDACYWDIDTTALQESAGGEARTTDEMTYPYEVNTYEGWDFAGTWAPDVDYNLNDGYPCLRVFMPVEEGEGEIPAEGEGESPVEGEAPQEGEGEAGVEGEGETPAEGEVPEEGEGEPVSEGEPSLEGEGEAPVEGESMEGEGESEEGESCGCCKAADKNLVPREGLERMLGDWLLIGLSTLTLAAGAFVQR